MVIRSLDVAVDVEVMKLGEYPPFSAPISSRIQKLLSKSDLDLYRKGVRAEAQGLGVGAATYFRRIVDEQWTRFVKEIRKAAELLGVEDLGVYDVALQETQFSRAVKTLKDAIPEKFADLGRRKPADVAVSATQQAVAYANGRGVPSAGGGHPGSSDRFTGEHCGRVEESRRAPRSGDEVKEPEAATRMTSPKRLRAFVPKKLRALPKLQTDLPRISKDRRLLSIIEHAIQKIPTVHDPPIGAKFALHGP